MTHERLSTIGAVELILPLFYDLSYTAAVRPPPGCDPNAIVLTFPVAREFAGLRVDRFIQRRIPRLSRTRARAIVDACAFTEAGRKLRAGSRVQPGNTVLLVRERLIEPDCPTNFSVLFEDDAVVAIDKPPGLPMHPTATYHRNTLTYQLRLRYGEEAPTICHRIDRETSGLILCARHREIERTIKAAFESRRVTKRYLAIVRGRVRESRGEIDLPIGPATTGLHVLMEVKRSGGSTAKTRFELVDSAPSHSLLALFPETGRQHQLRVHLAAIGHSIVGDKLYGPEGALPFIETIDSGMTPGLLERLGHPRQALHAMGLRLQHPGAAAGKEVALKIEAPMAPDMASLWARLKQPMLDPAAPPGSPRGSCGDVVAAPESA